LQYYIKVYIDDEDLHYYFSLLSSCAALISFMLPATLRPHTGGEQNSPVRGANNASN